MGDQHCGVRDVSLPGTERAGGDWFITGFSPRAQALTIYVMPGVESFPVLMRSLGKYTTGKSCIYVKKLDDIHLPTLKKLVQASFKELKKRGYRIEAE